MASVGVTRSIRCCGVPDDTTHKSPRGQPLGGIATSCNRIGPWGSSPSQGVDPWVMVVTSAREPPRRSAHPTRKAQGLVLPLGSPSGFVRRASITRPSLRWRCNVQRTSQAKPAAGIAFSSHQHLNPEQSAARWLTQMLITLSVGEVKTVYARCGKQQRGATPKAAQTRIEQGTLAPCLHSPWMA